MHESIGFKNALEDHIRGGCRSEDREDVNGSDIVVIGNGDNGSINEATEMGQVCEIAP